MTRRFPPRIVCLHRLESGIILFIDLDFVDKTSVATVYNGLRH